MPRASRGSRGSLASSRLTSGVTSLFPGLCRLRPLLFWLYLLATFLLLGGELNALLDERAAAVEPG
jgi:hypothetical protein